MIDVAMDLGQEREDRERTLICVVSDLLRKIGLYFVYPVGGQFLSVEEAFWVWVVLWGVRWRQSNIYCPASYPPLNLVRLL